MAADLTKYLLGPADVEMVIQAEDCIWCDIGSGKFTEYSSTTVDFQGKLTRFDPGPFDLGLTVEDDVRCKINLNGHEYQGTYTTDSGNGDHGEIVVKVPDGTIAIYQWHSGTRVDPSFSHNVWIGEDNSLRRRQNK